MKVIEKIKICEKCKGSGKITSYERWGPVQEWKDEECPVCNGTGRLNMKLTIEIQPYLLEKKLSSILTDKQTEEKR